MMEKLWGDNYFDQKAKKWKNHSKPDDPAADDLKRAFVSLIMEPVIRLCRATMNGEMEKVNKMIDPLGIVLKADEKGL
jgi:elongation factor 2